MPESLQGEIVKLDLIVCCPNTHLIDPKILPLCTLSFVRLDRVKHKQNWHNHAEHQRVLEMRVESKLHDISSEFQSSNCLNETRENPPADKRIDEC